MKLRELVDQHKKMVKIPGTVRTWNYHTKEYENQVYYRQAITEDSRKIIEDKVKEFFKSKGWNSKKKKPGRNKKPKLGYISKKPGHHTYIDWEISERGYVYIKLKSLTQNGGYAIESYSEDDLESLIRRAMKIDRPSMLSKDNLPPTYSIGAQEDITTRREHHNASTNHRWRTVRCLGVIGLEKDGSISEEKAFDPNEKVWFHCAITGYSDASASFITDGNVLHPIKTQGKLRVTTRCPSILKLSTSMDKELLEKAISTYFNEE